MKKLSREMEGINCFDRFIEIIWMINANLCDELLDISEDIELCHKAAARGHPDAMYLSNAIRNEDSNHICEMDAMWSAVSGKIGIHTPWPCF